MRKETAGSIRQYRAKWGSALWSDLLQGRNLLFVALVEVLGEQLERLVDVPALHCADLSELKADAHGEGVPVLGADLDTVLKVALVGHDDALQLSVTVLLLNAGVPVLQQAERLLICGVVHKHYLVCLAQ